MTGTSYLFQRFNKEDLEDIISGYVAAMKEDGDPRPGVDFVLGVYAGLSAGYILSSRGDEMLAFQELFPTVAKDQRMVTHIVGRAIKENWRGERNH